MLYLLVKLVSFGIFCCFGECLFYFQMLLYLVLFIDIVGFVSFYVVLSYIYQGMFIMIRMRRKRIVFFVRGLVQFYEDGVYYFLYLENFIKLGK